MKPRAVALGLLVLGFVSLLGVQGPGVQGPIYKKRDFSTNDLSQWTHLECRRASSRRFDCHSYRARLAGSKQ